MKFGAFNIAGATNFLLTITVPLVIIAFSRACVPSLSGRPSQITDNECLPVFQFVFHVHFPVVKSRRWRYAAQPVVRAPAKRASSFMMP